MFLQIRNQISILLPWDTGDFFNGSDFVLGPIYLTMILVFAYLGKNIVVKDPELRKYFMPGLVVKLIGSILVGVIYAFYYKGGDTSSYFYDSSILYQAFLESPSSFFKILLHPANNFDPELYDYVVQMRFENDKQAFIVSKITGVMALLSFRTYSVSSMLYAFFSYAGVWALFTTFCKIYPNLKRQFAIAVLFLPSVFFWGSGILKDTITFSCVGWMTWCTYNIFIKRSRVITSVIILLLVMWLAASIKAYIVISIIPAIALWVFLNFRNRIRSTFIKIISGPLIFSSGLVVAYILVNSLSADNDKYSINKFTATAQTFQASNAVNVQGDQASIYDVGQGSFDGSIGSYLRVIPLSINVTLFRPYPWEIKSPVMVLSAIESIFFLFFTIRIMIRVGVLGFFRSIGRNSFVFFCMSYSLLFAFAVGFSASNFGALVRYKIPCLPFYLAALYIMNNETLQLKAKRKADRLRKKSTDFILTPKTQL